MEAENGVLKGYKIFVAEDDRDVQAFMKRCLEYYGAHVTAVSNGRDAVDTLLHETFDVALMDIEMPLCDGLEAAGRVREKGYREPIVALSSLCSRPELQLSLDAKFDEKLDKPVVVPTLIETILHLKEKHDEILLKLH
ncbi:MAG: response regulator [Bdellovibrionota bacterium]